MFAPTDMTFTFATMMGASVDYFAGTAMIMNMSPVYSDLVTVRTGSFLSPAALVDVVNTTSDALLHSIKIYPGGYVGASATVIGPLEINGLLANASSVLPGTRIQKGDVYVGSFGNKTSLGVAASLDGEHDAKRKTLSARYKFLFICRRCFALINAYIMFSFLAGSYLISVYIFDGIDLIASGGTTLWDHILTIFSIGFCGFWLMLLSSVPLMWFDQMLLKAAGSNLEKFKKKNPGHTLYGEW